MITTLGFIGSGTIGGILARHAVAAGIDVVLSNSRGPGSLADLVAELGPRARAATPAEAAEAGDLVVVSIPFGAYETLPTAQLAGRTVIDTLNYYPERDGRIAELDGNELTSSELLQRHLAGSRVVKAAGNIVSSQLAALARPSGAPDRSGMPIAGDDASAKAEVAALLDDLGYDAVDIGTLADSWRSEPGTPVYGKAYYGEVPAGLSDDETMGWIFSTPGSPVPADRVRELTVAAVRGRAGGSLSIDAWT
ncbi:NADPH-dependent F420 reductase [Rathayibacter sp. Leaf296]|uniref:NADPH-dependent F420 reductase n=1 Tax=Rathayibacter sp. Leaf296 TaxID=1736327 RepID=UPI000702671F|nr:NAD(P)-binding domain-containing protein [Rathayibacter sp. Leaf296]KQQ08215.1 oxidoreductase [Rathayibacter sp. Leaf296]